MWVRLAYLLIAGIIKNYALYGTGPLMPKSCTITACTSVHLVIQGM